MAKIHPTTISKAKEFVRLHHRHHGPPVSGLFAASVLEDEETVGVVIVGRPVARMLQDGVTAEVTRLCVLEGHKNACSMLYAAAWRACRALGYQRLVTYILDSEPGTSLKAAGWKIVGSAGGGSWSRPSRKRVDKHPTQFKFRWERRL